MRTNIRYFKQELYKIPKEFEATYTQKYHDYQERVKQYEYDAKKLELELKDDTKGLLALERGIETKKRSYGSSVNQETQQLANKGFDTQKKSKESLQRTLGKVNETNVIASQAVADLEAQNA